MEAKESSDLKLPCIVSSFSGSACGDSFGFFGEPGFPAPVLERLPFLVISDSSNKSSIEKAGSFGSAMDAIARAS